MMHVGRDIVTTSLQKHNVKKIDLTPKLSVTANRELIARFEKKIQATLARVWGEDEKPTGET